jgi:hypothetical protein
MQQTNVSVTSRPGFETSRPANETGRTPGALKVGDLVCNRMARLPPWFTVEQARKIATLRGVEHVLVEERGKITGSVSRYTLWRAPRLETLARHLQPISRTVSTELPINEVRAEMQALGTDCLPVASGGILVGTITLADIDFNLECGSAAA